MHKTASNKNTSGVSVLYYLFRLDSWGQCWIIFLIMTFTLCMCLKSWTWGYVVVSLGWIKYSYLCCMVAQAWAMVSNPAQFIQGKILSLECQIQITLLPCARTRTLLSKIYIWRSDELSIYELVVSWPESYTVELYSPPSKLDHSSE